MTLTASFVAWTRAAAVLHLLRGAFSLDRQYLAVV